MSRGGDSVVLPGFLVSTPPLPAAGPRPLVPSPGTPGEGYGEGSAANWVVCAFRQSPHPRLSRSTGRGEGEALRQGHANRVTCGRVAADRAAPGHGTTHRAGNHLRPVPTGPGQRPFAPRRPARRAYAQGAGS